MKRMGNEETRIIWIGFQDRESRLREYAAKHGLVKNIAFDHGDAVSKQFGIKYGAGVVIINREGVVKARLSKGFSGKSLRESYNTALSEGSAQK